MKLTKGGTTKNGPIEWTPEWNKEFWLMKLLIAKDTILAYPYFSKKFTIHTEASDVQLGAVIMEEGKPLDFYSRKLS